MNRIQNQLTTVSVLLLALILSPAVPSAAGQNGSTAGQEYPARLSPAMAIIIVVLVAALFFMAFFSIYIRRCSNANSGGTIRPILSMRRRAAAARGLEAQVIETFPTFPYSEVKGLQIGKGALECAVCLNEFEDDETLRLIPKCDHVFHPECIDAWLESHVTCPVCRANLVPEDGEVSVQENINNGEQQENGDVLVPISDDIETNRPNNNNNTTESETEETLPEVIIIRSASAKQNQNRPPRSRSVRPRLFERFRSHSTGHSLVQAGENVDRFTLRLLPEVRKEVMKRALLNRTASSVVVRGYRAGEGSSRGKSIRRLESLDEQVKSDRWGFSRVPSFLSRAFSVRSPKVAAAAVANGEASTSSMIPIGPMRSDEPGPVPTESVRPPV